MTVNEKLGLLRQKMSQAGIAACIIPSADPHMSEYFSDHWKTRAFLSGFSGSAGTVAVTMDESGLWTDGRYYTQAAGELEGSEIRLFRASDRGCPTYYNYLADHLPKGSVIGLNGMLFPADLLEKMGKIFEKKGITVNLAVDFANEIWENRPPEHYTEIYCLDECYTGRPAKEKLAALREELKKAEADALVISKLDCIAWLFNIRSSDIFCNPVVIAYAYVDETRAVLFTERSRMPENAAENLKENGVTIQGYDEILSFIQGLAQKSRVLCDKQELNGALYRQVMDNPNLTMVKATNPVFLMKSRKNPTENRCTYNAYLKDGCALAEFYAWLEDAMDRGETLREYDLTLKLSSLRAAQPLNRGDSFPAIVAYRENAAMMHYAPKEEGSKLLEKSHLLLIDSGAQYLDGTTDITRTIALGPVTDEEKRDFTNSLKGAIRLMQAVFLEGTSGKQLDILCREPLWRLGLNYRCGTGHGVGFHLNVHEGPQGFNGDVKLEPGMVLTVEPGVYTEGSHGIRTENVVEVVMGDKTEYGQFLRFENFTRVPIDTACIEPSLLDQEEVDWLNQYHALVYKEVAPLVSDRARQWLEKKTQPISK